jgi:putative endonuclease
MMPHIRTGKLGETLAAEWLTANGFHILHRNWRHGRYEVDLIAAKDNAIHMVEVKCRTSSAYGSPEQSVSRKKIEHLLQGAQGWLLNNGGLTRIQYDVLAITLHKSAGPEYVLFTDVYL